MFPSYRQLCEIIFDKGKLVFPENVHQSILENIKGNPVDIITGQKFLREKYTESYTRPPKINYSQEILLDSYITFFLPRHFFVPKIAIKNLSLCSEATEFSSTLKILDLGSGTGAVTLGLFDLFSNNILREYSIEVTAVDKYSESLKKQENILSRADYLNDKRFNWKHIQLDINNTERTESLILSENWDLIFSVNFLNELEKDDYINFLVSSIRCLSERGSLIVYEPPHDRIKEAISAASIAAKALGANIFLPCPKGRACQRGKCWMWHYYDVECDDFGRIPTSRKRLSVASIIVNKSGYSIYDYFRNHKPNLKWTVGWRLGKDYEVEKDIILCGERRNYSLPNKVVRRGAIFGVSSTRIEEFFEI